MKLKKITKEEATELVGEYKFRGGREFFVREAGMPKCVELWISRGIKGPEFFMDFPVMEAING